MNRTVKKVFAVVNPDKADISTFQEEIEEFFLKKDVELVSCTLKDKDKIMSANLNGSDLALSFGGDGTLLFCARAFVDKNIPILAVNLGTFGFITEVSFGEWKQTYEQFVAGNLGISERIMIQVKIIRQGREIGFFHGLNDAVICTEGISRLLALKLFLSESYVGRYQDLPEVR